MLKIFSLVAVVMCIGLGADAGLQCACKYKYGYWPKYGDSYAVAAPKSWKSYGGGASYGGDWSYPSKFYGDSDSYAVAAPKSWKSYGGGASYGSDLSYPASEFYGDSGSYGVNPSNAWNTYGGDGWSCAVPQFNLRLPGLDGQYSYSVRHNVRHAVRHRIRHLYKQTGLENYRARSLRLKGLSGTRNYRVGHNVGHTVKHNIRHKFRTVPCACCKLSLICDLQQSEYPLIDIDEYCGDVMNIP